MPLDWQNVWSSHIAALAYDSDASELHVRYQNGKTAVYEGVSADKAAQVSQAPSIGMALHQLVRGKHSHRYAGDEAV